MWGSSRNEDPFRILLIRVPYCSGGRKRYPDWENYPYSGFMACSSIKGVLGSLGGGEKLLVLLRGPPGCGTHARDLRNQKVEDAGSTTCFPGIARGFMGKVGVGDSGFWIFQGVMIGKGPSPRNPENSS